MIAGAIRRVDPARALPAHPGVSASAAPGRTVDLARGDFLRGMADADAGRVNAGIAHIERAVAMDARGDYRAQLARLYMLVRRDGDAAATLAAVERALPGDALSRDTMGCAYARLGDHAAALAHFDHAVRLRPDTPDYRYNLAVTLNFLGRTAEATAALEALIALAPGHARAHHLLAGLSRQSKEANHVDRLVAARAAATDGRDRLLLGYALCKELEDVGDPVRALDILCEANAEHRRSLSYDPAHDAAAFDAVEAAWPVLRDAPDAGAPTDAPIFVIGMPRTGTTLVDRILSSHPAVESAGELQALPLAVKAAAGTRTATVLDPETIAAAARADVAAIGRDYLSRARAHRRDVTRRFTDKFPGNFRYAGFIARALPNARILCLRRHPMDTVLANFRNLFAVGSRYYDYSYDLAEIAEHVVRFERLVALWRDALPSRFLEIGYEAIVADQEGSTRRMLDHCGLDWSDRCLSFHANRAPVSTPSAAQVRRPIYADSVGRWRRHAAVLEPAARVFARAGLSIA